MDPCLVEEKRFLLPPPTAGLALAVWKKADVSV